MLFRGLSLLLVRAVTINFHPCYYNLSPLWEGGYSSVVDIFFCQNACEIKSLVKLPRTRRGIDLPFILFSVMFWLLF